MSCRRQIDTDEVAGRGVHQPGRTRGDGGGNQGRVEGHIDRGAVADLAGTVERDQITRPRQSHEPLTHHTHQRGALTTHINRPARLNTLHALHQTTIQRHRRSVTQGHRPTRTPRQLRSTQLFQRDRIENADRTTRIDQKGAQIPRHERRPLRSSGITPSQVAHINPPHLTTNIDIHTRPRLGHIDRPAPLTQLHPRINPARVTVDPHHMTLSLRSQPTRPIQQLHRRRHIASTQNHRHRHRHHGGNHTQGDRPTRRPQTTQHEASLHMPHAEAAS